MPHGKPGQVGAPPIKVRRRRVRPVRQAPAPQVRAAPRHRKAVQQKPVSHLAPRQPSGTSEQELRKAPTRKVARRVVRQRQQQQQGQRKEARRLRVKAISRGTTELLPKPYKGLHVLDTPGGRETLRHAPSLKGASGKNILGFNTKTPALKLLEQTTRPVHAIAGGLYAAETGKSPVKGAIRGAQLKDRKLFSDVLKKAGLPKGVSSVGGFGLDVAADPTTYVSFGVGGVAKHAAEKAALSKAAERAALPKRAAVPTGVGKKAEKQALRRAVKQGKPLPEAKSLGQKARQQADVGMAERKTRVADTRAIRRAQRSAEGTAPEGRGIQTSLGSLKTSGRTTARLAKPLRREPGQLRTNLKDVGATFSPHVKPADISPSEFQGLKSAERQARAGVQRGRFRAVQRARAMQEISVESHPQVIDAIERGTVYNLPDHLKAPAKAIQREFRRARKAELKAGVPTPKSRIGYFTHQLEQAGAETPKVKRGGTVLRPGFTKERRFKGTIKRIEEQEGPQFSKNVPAVLGERLAKSSQTVSKARLGQAIAKAGRPVKAGQKLNPSDAVYEVEKGKAPRALALTEPDDRKLLGQVLEGKAAQHKQYVVLNRREVDRVMQATSAFGERRAITRAYDKTTGGFKFAATYPNPGFHARNLVGDTFNAYLGEPLPKLLRSAGTAGRGLKRLGGREEAMLKPGGKVQEKGPMVSVRDHAGRKSSVSLDQITREAEKHGVIRTGFFGREIPELTRSSETQVSKAARVKGKLGPAKRAGRGAKRTLQNREDLMRLSLFIAGRKRGLTAEGAAAHSLKQLFDYGDLSTLERGVMRRIAPFYTWTSRNIPLQARTLVSRPGKYANLEKAREEASKASGADLKKVEGKLPEYQQRALPIPVKIGGKTFVVSFGAGGIPASDLNQLSLSPDEQGKKFASLLNPLIRTPAELFANYSTFFRGQIERDESPLVKAPAWVKTLPPKVQKDLHIVSDFQDRKTGKKTWGWPAKLDYVAKQPPGPFNFLQQITTEGANRRGQGKGQKLLSYGTGLKVDPVNADSRVQALFDERKSLLKKRATLRQRGIGSADYGRKETKQYRKVRDRIKSVEKEITHLSKQRGDKSPLLGRPKRKSKGGSLLGGGSSSGKSLLGGGGGRSKSLLGP